MQSLVVMGALRPGRQKGRVHNARASATSAVGELTERSPTITALPTKRDIAAPRHPTIWQDDGSARSSGVACVSVVACPHQNLASRRTPT